MGNFMAKYILPKFDSQEAGIQKKLIVVKELENVLKELTWPCLPSGRKRDKSLKTLNTILTKLLQDIEKEMSQIYF